MRLCQVQAIEDGEGSEDDGKSCFSKEEEAESEESERDEVVVMDNWIRIVCPHDVSGGSTALGRERAGNHHKDLYMRPFVSFEASPFFIR